VIGTWTYLPVALFLLLALAQLIPLPHALLSVISPNTLDVKSRLLADVPGAVAGAVPLTFYANATLHDLRMVLACAVIFVVGLNVLRTRGRIKRVLIAISTVGGLVILLALAQDITGAAKMYWTFSKPIQAALGGPFIGHNDFPPFANLSIGAAAALLMYILRERRSSRTEYGSRRSSRRGFPWHRVPIGALIGLIVLGMGAVFLSLSRSGLVALGASAICITVIVCLRWRLSMERWLMGVCVLVCFAVSFYVASDSVSHRLATLSHPLDEYGSRWQIVKDILAAWPQFPLFGTGLGTHEVVYPMFEHLLATANFDHAENEYAQMLEETGAIGLAIILLFVGSMVAAFFRAVRKSRHSPIGAACFGLGMGLFAVAVQSGFGFGAHVAANAVLVAVECALLLNVARLSQSKAAVPPSPAAMQFETELSRNATLSWALKSGGAIVVCLLFVPALLGADRARRGEAEWEPARQFLADPANFFTLSDDQNLDMIASAQRAHQAEPDNVRYFYWQVYFAWQALERKHDPNADEDVRPAADKAQVKHLVEQFDAVRRLAPTYGFAIYQAGQLRYLVLDEPQALNLIRLAASVASTTPSIFSTLASIDCDQGDFIGAMQAYRHYLSLDGIVRGSFEEVVNTLVTGNKRPDLAMELAGTDPDRQLSIVRALRNLHDRPDFQTLATTIEANAQAARRAELIDRCRTEDASAADLAALAEIYRSEHDLNRSIDCYQRALAKEYDQMDWHLNLAELLLDAGRPSDAVEEASICLRRQPHMPAAEQLISEAQARTRTPDKP